MNNKVVLQSMALDLKRVAIAYHTNSLQTAERFLDETLKRKMSLDYAVLPKSLLQSLHFLEHIPHEKSVVKRADDALMLSTLFISFAKAV